MLAAWLATHVYKLPAFELVKESGGLQDVPAMQRNMNDFNEKFKRSPFDGPFQDPIEKYPLELTEQTITDFPVCGMDVPESG